jgi:DHA1 family bicyclomycin/chloramphenicol resistance-like MFS transporter
MNQPLAKTMVLITIIIMDFLSGMEFDLFVPSFPELQSQFSLSAFWVEALLSVNFAGYCLSLFFVGGLGDSYGRKPIILMGLITFAIGSIFCLWAESYNYFLIGRFLQGVGIAAPAILSFLIIADAYPLKQQQFLMAMLNGVMNIAVGAAPVIGSYVTLYFHWQGNFMALLILGIMSLVMTMLFIPNIKTLKHAETLSLRGYLSIFHSKPMVLLLVNLLFIFVPYWIFVGMSPLLYMQDLGVSLAHFGYYQGAFALVFALGSILFGLMIKNNNYNQKKLLYISMNIFIVSIIFMGVIILFGSRNPLLITLAFLCFVIGQIVPTTILYPLCLNFIPQTKGRVSAIIQGASLVLMAIGLQISGYFYAGTFRSIGIILIGFILVAVITLYFVLKNGELTQHI